MTTISIRDFARNVTRVLARRSKTVATRRGEPVAIVVPLPSGGTEALVLKMTEIFRKSGVTDSDIERAVKEARREMHVSRRD